MKIKFRNKFYRLLEYKKSIFFIILFVFIIYIFIETKEIVKQPDYFDENNKKIVNDVTQLNPINVENVYTPKNNQEIQDILKNSKGKISIGGTRKSMGGQTATLNGVQIDMREFNKILELSTSTKTITVQAGVKWSEIQQKIDPHNLSVMIMQSYNNFSVGGSISTNVHGRYIGYGPLIESIISFRLITADGKLLNVSRDENSELFYAVIGGYGAFGVITDATLKLADNVNLERKVEKVKVSNYVEYFKNNIINNENIIFQNADIYVNDYQDANSIIWEISDKEKTEKESFISKNQSYALNRFSWFAMSEFPYGNELREYLLDPILNRKESVHSRNYEASYDVSELEPSSRKESTYVLQEYFIPVDKFDEFVSKMKKVFENNEVNVLNISIRHAKKDEGSLLAWAPKSDVFAFVIYYKQGTSVSEKSKVSKWTKEMINEIISVEGTYYLPYQPQATYEQFKNVYKNYDKFFKLKEKYDPQYRFTNSLWDKYYTEYLKEKNKDSKNKLNIPIVSKEEFPKYFERKYEQTYLTLPEWHMVYSYNEFASFLMNNGSQKDYPFFEDIKRFWKYYKVSKDEIGIIDNNQYRNMIYVIGTSFTIEYSLKLIYENTIGRVTEFLFGNDTITDKYIANSWLKFSNSLKQTPWYEFDYFGEIKYLWKEISLFEGNFIRNFERKIALTLGYGIKGIYGKVIKYLSQSTYGVQENKTLSLVKAREKDILNLEKNGDLKILKKYEDNYYLIETERYNGFKEAFLKILENNISFEEIMSHKNIMVTYLSNQEFEPFEYSENVKILSKEKIFFNDNNYKYRVVVKVEVNKLIEFINDLNNNYKFFEMIYDF